MAALKLSPSFALLCERFLDEKAKEAKAIEDRRAVGVLIEALPEVVEHKKPSGSVAFRDDALECEVRYVESESIDLDAFGKGLSHEAMKRIFPALPAFSKTAYNQYTKELKGAAVHDPAAKKLLDKIEKAYQECRTTKPGATQITVKRVESV